MRRLCSSDPPRMRTAQRGLCRRSSRLATAPSASCHRRAAPDDQVAARLVIRPPEVLQRGLMPRAHGEGRHAQGEVGLHPRPELGGRREDLRQRFADWVVVVHGSAFRGLSCQLLVASCHPPSPSRCTNRDGTAQHDGTHAGVFAGKALGADSALADLRNAPWPELNFGFQISISEGRSRHVPILLRRYAATPCQQPLQTVDWPAGVPSLPGDHRTSAMHGTQLIPTRALPCGCAPPGFTSPGV